MKTAYIYLIISLSIVFLSCKKEKHSKTAASLDYSKSYYWASLPIETNKNVDVFFVHPTIFGGTEEMNMDITNDDLRLRVQSVLLKQASIFSKHCNIYTPYYKQMSFDGLSLNPKERNRYFSIGMEDIEQAFDYYINHLNKGRPFILAGHSQGSQILINLMKLKFHDPKLMKKLIAAYLIGYSVTNNDITEANYLKIAKSANDTGVIITYNTQSEGALDSPVLLPHAKCVNPLNWKNNSEYASKELNLGAIFFKENGDIDSIVPQFTDAWIDKNGALVVNTPKIETYSTPNFPKGVYHKYDYSFFYKNLEKNVDERIKAYSNKTK